MKEQNITIDKLAGMVQKGFNETTKNMDRQFAGVNKRLDRIENILLINHRERIEKLEEDVINLKGLLAVT